MILPKDNSPGDSVPPPQAYWNACGSLYAYLFIALSRLQIDVVGMSQLIGYPTQYPSVSMMDWTENQPNARFQVLKLIKDSFHPGDKLVATDMPTGDVVGQAYVTVAGRRLLLANKRNRTIEIAVPDSVHASALMVDETTGDGPARRVKLANGNIALGPFAVAVVEW